MTMPSTIDDGGPAWPAFDSEVHDGTNAYPRGRPGMSLRDWYAGQALAGMLAHPGDTIRGSYGGVARAAYEYADAMIKARKAHTQPEDPTPCSD